MGGGEACCNTLVSINVIDCTSAQNQQTPGQLSLAIPLWDKLKSEEAHHVMLFHNVSWCLAIITFRKCGIEANLSNGQSSQMVPTENNI